MQRVVFFTRSGGSFMIALIVRKTQEHSEHSTQDAACVCQEPRCSHVVPAIPFACVSRHTLLVYVRRKASGGLCKYRSQTAECLELRDGRQTRVQNLLQDALQESCFIHAASRRVGREACSSSSRACHAQGLEQQ